MNIVAVIDIGSSSIRLDVSEISENEGVHPRVLESADKSYTLGIEVYEKQKISNETISTAISIINDFKEMFSCYNVDKVIAFGTSSLREAVNSDTFIDRVLMQTGLEVEILSGLEVNQITYMAVIDVLKSNNVNIENENTLILEISGGSTEIMALEKGELCSNKTLPLGTIRHKHNLPFSSGPDHKKISNFLKNQTVRMLRNCEPELDLGKYTRIVTLGASLRLISKIIGHTIDDGIYSLPTDEFLSFADTVLKLSIEEIVHKYGLNYTEAEYLIPSLVIHKTIIRKTKSTEMIIPSITVREGLFQTYAYSPHKIKKILSRQIYSSAWSIANHYSTDIKHSEFVLESSKKIYNALQDGKLLDGQDLLLLEIASILHDIGTFISGTSHHKHGQYLVLNSEIFGINDKEKAIIANVVRYHRRALPNITHNAYSKLRREDRLTVKKLSAIIRVADALDRSHQQRLSQFIPILEKERIVIKTNFNGDRSIEKISIKEKSDLFREVYGLKVVLQ